jgi:selenide,water dikinase
MQKNLQPILTDLVLMGGGHSHAIALRMFGMNPLPGVRLTLLTEASDAPYSGMLPGHVAGFYTREECHIDLRRLANVSGAQLYIDRAIGLDLENNRVLCANRPPVAFDLLSIDIGSTPKLPDIMTDASTLIPAKPVRQFLEQWEQIVQQIAQTPAQPVCLGIVGGGAGGVELALTMQQRIQAILYAAGQSANILTMHLFQREAELLPKHNPWVRDRFRHLLAERGIQLHFQETVRQVQQSMIHCNSGLTVRCDYVFWVTQASAPAWLGKAGLAVDDAGFVLVDDTLRSLSHPQVFAAGDIATMVNHPRPKAGVFAVRQGKPLFRNLQRILQGKPLIPYHPQQHYLSLIGTGDGSAIASRGPFGCQSHWLWRWKDQIDLAFMRQFSQLPDMETAEGERVRKWRIGGWGGWGGWGGREDERNARTQNSAPRTQSPMPHPPPPTPSMHCAGCGAKVGNTILERTLQRIQQLTVSSQQLTVSSQQLTVSSQHFPPSSPPCPLPRPLHPSHPPSSPLMLIGLDAPDDAAVFQVPPGKVLVQTIDYFPALINDPFLFGQIAANHALSDVFAMGAEAHSALAIATIPYGTAAAVEETLYQLLSGALQVLQQANAVLIGGHTTEAADLAFGLSCNGLADSERLLRKSGMQVRQALILTKAIGTGTLFAAQMRGKAKGYWIDAAVASMLQSNRQAAACFLDYGATACTDITGFGLVGHLLEMIRASGVTVNLNLAAIPLLEGAQDTVNLGITSSLQPQNLRASQWIDNLDQVSEHPKFPLLFDPQTSGGLLASVPQQSADACLAALHRSGYASSAIIGYTGPRYC